MRDPYQPTDHAVGSGLMSVVSRCVSLCGLLALLPVVAFAGDSSGTSSPSNDPSSDNQRARFEQLRIGCPSTAWLTTGQLVSRVYGDVLGRGADPADSANGFVTRHAGLFGVDPADLTPASTLFDARHTQPVMFDRANGRYKFTLVYYSQRRAGLPVFGAELRLLVRNEPGFPVVLAASTLRPLGDFTVDAQTASRPFDPATQARTGMTQFSPATPVIWAGVENEVTAPALAATFVGENGRTDAGMEIWRFVCDAATGDVLHKESLIQFADVTGTVQAVATTGTAADNCANEILVPFPWAKVSIAGGATAFADANGQFTIPNAGDTDVTVTSFPDGLYFDVRDLSGPLDTLVATVTPPGPAQFIHNEANNQEFVLAQVNAYLAATACRAWVLNYNPAFPGASTALDVRVNVNRNDGACPCNAWANFSAGSINFCRAGGGCNNSAFQSIVYHEYGHLCINWAGSGQGAYGEGMADCFALLPYDIPDIGIGLNGNCGVAMRSADNNCQFSAGCSTCGSAIHDCGKLLSGIVWSIRNQLQATDPTEYLDIISNLVVNSVLLHTGSAINQQIVIDLLTLDDDDGQIGNGTPHRPQICAGAASHGIACPVLDSEMSISPSTGSAAFGAPGGAATPSSFNYTLHNLSGVPVNYAVTNSAAWITLGNNTGTVPGGASAIITATINANAATLPAGTFTDTLTFTNLSTHVGDTTRVITLTISVPRLTITPTDGLNASGEVGGPFTPPAKIYVLQNTGGDTLNYTVSQADSWYSLSADSGALAPGALAQVIVTLNSAASVLPVGLHTSAITFTNLTNSVGNAARGVSLQVAPLTNDLCINATSACPGFVYTGTTVGRTVDVASICDPANSTPDVWHRYTPSADGPATITLCTGTTYDAVLSIFSGCPAQGGAELVCDDDGCGTGGGPSIISNFFVIGGTTYYLRVSGWGAATGNYTMTLDGPPCSQAVYISLPDGTPPLLSPDSPVSFNVQIDDGLESYVPGTGRLHYRYTGETYSSVPLMPLGGPLHIATLPAAPCGILPTFYLSADGNAGGESFSPFNAPIGVYNAHVGTQSPFAEFDFEAATDEGWTVGDPTDNATSGIWNRADPEPTTAQPGDDHTPGIGTICWVTDSRAGTSPASFDVDGGRTTLKSPVFNLAGFTDGVVSYWRWYDNSHGTAPNADTFLIDISNNGGASWVNVETLGPSGPDSIGGWIYHEFLIANYVTPTSQIRMRFVAQDTGAASLVEAAIDDFTLIGQNCIGSPTCATILGDLDGNGSINGRDISGFVTAILTTYQPCADFSGNQQADVSDIPGMVQALLAP